MSGDRPTESVSISFPTTGGRAVSSHTLLANFLVLGDQDLGGGLGDIYDLFLIDF